MAKLNETRICLDCEEVFDENEFRMCPKCASLATASLLLWVVPLEAVWGKNMLHRPADKTGTESGAA